MDCEARTPAAQSAQAAVELLHRATATPCWDALRRERLGLPDPEPAPAATAVPFGWFVVGGDAETRVYGNHALGVLIERADGWTRHDPAPGGDGRICQARSDDGVVALVVGSLCARVEVRDLADWSLHAAHDLPFEAADLAIDGPDRGVARSDDGRHAWVWWPGTAPFPVDADHPLTHPDLLAALGSAPPPHAAPLAVLRALSRAGGARPAEGPLAPAPWVGAPRTVRVTTDPGAEVALGREIDGTFLGTGRSVADDAGEVRLEVPGSGWWVAAVRDTGLDEELGIHGSPRAVAVPDDHVGSDLAFGPAGSLGWPACRVHDGDRPVVEAPCADVGALVPAALAGPVAIVRSADWAVDVWLRPLPAETAWVPGLRGARGVAGTWRALTGTWGDGRWQVGGATVRNPWGADEPVIAAWPGGVRYGAHGTLLVTDRDHAVWVLADAAQVVPLAREGEAPPGEVPGLRACLRGRAAGCGRARAGALAALAGAALRGEAPGDALERAWALGWPEVAERVAAGLRAAPPVEAPTEGAWCVPARRSGPPLPRAWPPAGASPGESGPGYRQVLTGRSGAAPGVPGELLVLVAPGSGVVFTADGAFPVVRWPAGGRLRSSRWRRGITRSRGPDPPASTG